MAQIGSNPNSSLRSSMKATITSRGGRAPPRETSQGRLQDLVRPAQFPVIFLEDHADCSLTKLERVFLLGHDTEVPSVASLSPISPGRSDQCATGPSEEVRCIVEASGSDEIRSRPHCRKYADGHKAADCQELIHCGSRWEPNATTNRLTSHTSHSSSDSLRHPRGCHGRQPVFQ